MEYTDPYWTSEMGSYANCYAFACSTGAVDSNIHPDILFKLSPNNNPPYRTTKATFLNGLEQDGLKQISSPSACGKGYYPIAFMAYYTDEGDECPYDFHFFKLETIDTSEQRWSSKWSGSPPTIETADFNPSDGYTHGHRTYEFVVFFAVPEPGLIPKHLERYNAVNELGESGRL
ncbi:MAG: hypothetical protein AAFY76_16715 [Cyanobacteria bacterium J06649_11]